jgi:phage N-6-adenine-methyltransferase
MPKMPNSPVPSGRDDWTTPLDFFQRVNAEFGLRLDAAATAGNTLCPTWLADAFGQEWSAPAWCNPPYGRVAVPKWLKRGIDEHLRTGHTTVFLLPAAVETKWFHEIAVPNALEIRLLRGRLKFGNVICKDGTIGEAAAQFPSALVILRRAMWGHRPRCLIRAWDWRKE